MFDVKHWMHSDLLIPSGTLETCCSHTMSFLSLHKFGIHISVPAQGQLHLAIWYAHFLGQV